MCHTRPISARRTSLSCTWENACTRDRCCGFASSACGEGPSSCCTPSSPRTALVRKGACGRFRKPVRLPDVGRHLPIDMRTDFTPDRFGEHPVFVPAAPGARLWQVTLLHVVGEKFGVAAVSNAQEIIEALLGRSMVAGKGLQRDGDF